jgi:alpha-beta hydrolase superfamily lysophospholipase
MEETKIAEGADFMHYREWDWPFGDGRKIFACTWIPEDERAVEAAVILVHGMGEHSGRYRHVAEMFTAHGFAVYAFDQHGHGRSEGKRGHIKRYEDLLDGIDRLLAEAAREFPGKPLFLYGHSMGGNVTLNYLLLRRPALTGAIVSSPWLKLAFDPPAMKVIAARVIGRIYPKFTDHRPFNPTHLTSDPDMMQMIREDPLGHGYITARFFFSVHTAGRWALAHASELSVPLLLMHGDSDTVTSLAASRLFAERAGDRCTFREWPGFRHELHNERNREEVFTFIRDWTAERTAIPLR